LGFPDGPNEPSGLFFEHQGNDAKGVVILATRHHVMSHPTDLLGNKRDLTEESLRVKKYTLRYTPFKLCKHCKI
jgi:hypothetical protein